MSTQNFRAVPGIVLLQREFGPKSGKDIASPRMPDPARDIFFPEASPVENRAGMPGGQGGNFRGQKIAEKAGPVIKAKEVPMFWR